MQICTAPEPFDTLVTGLGMAGQGEMYLVLPEFELYLYGARHFEMPAFLGQQETLVQDIKSLYCRIIFLPNLILVNRRMLLNKAFIIS